jgi:hypothetical protein
MELNFKDWLAENTKTTYKLGLYPDLYDVIGQYPPLYNTPRCADFIYYSWKKYGPTCSPPSKNGIVTVPDMHAG